MKEKEELKKITQSESDFVTNKVLTVFAGGILLIFIASMISNGLSYVKYMGFTLKFVGVMRIVGPVLAVLGLAFSAWQLTRKKYNSKTLFNGTGFAMFFALFSFCVHLMYSFGSERALRASYVIIPVFALLYLIYSVYPRDLFMCALTFSATAAFSGLIAQSAGSNAMGGFVVVFFAAGLLICALTALWFAITRKNGGVLKIGKVGIRFFEKGARGVVIYSVCALCAAALVVAFLATAPMAYYAMFAAIAALFVMAVYYTIKML